MCGLLGYNNERPVDIGLAHDLFMALHIRGTDSCGIAAFDRERRNISTTHWMKSSEKVTRDEFRSAVQGSPCFIAHSRMATSGAVSIDNAHPLQWNGIFLAHNGHVNSHLSYRKGHKIDSKLPDVDSFILPWTIGEGKTVTVGVKRMLSEIEWFGGMLFITRRSPHTLWVTTDRDRVEFIRYRGNRWVCSTQEIFLGALGTPRTQKLGDVHMSKVPTIDVNTYSIEGVYLLGPRSTHLRMTLPTSSGGQDWSRYRYDGDREDTWVDSKKVIGYKRSGTGYGGGVDGSKIVTPSQRNREIAEQFARSHAPNLQRDPPGKSGKTSRVGTVPKCEFCDEVAYYKVEDVDLCQHHLKMFNRPGAGTGGTH